MKCPYEYYACKGFDDLCISCAESEMARRKASIEAEMAARKAKALKVSRAAIQAQVTRHEQWAREAAEKVAHPA